MSYFYGNSLHIKLEEERDPAVSSDIYQYPSAMIPTRVEECIGQYNNGYPTSGMSYTLVPQSYMWSTDHSFLLHSQDQAAIHASGDTAFSPRSNPETEARSRKRRLPTVAQRRAANVRERKRMFNLNEAFDLLRRRVPTFAYEKRLSRIETLRLAISYIAFMTDIVNGRNPEEVKFRLYRNHTGDDLTRRQLNASLVSDENCQDSNGTESNMDESCSSGNGPDTGSEYESNGDE